MKRIILLTITLLLQLVATAQQYTTRQLDISNGLSSNYVTNITQDKDGHIWIATEEGLNKFHSNGFYTYYKKGNTGTITGNELNALLDDPADPVMWIGTQRDGLNAFDYRLHRFTSYRHNPKDPNSLITNDITHLSAAKGGNIWICTYWEGVDLLDKQTHTFKHYNTRTVKGMPSNQTWCALDDSEGHLYVGQVGHGLTIIDISKRTARHFMNNPKDDQSILGNFVHSLCRDSNGNIWVGTDKGLCWYDPQTGHFTPLTDNGRLSRRIFDIKEMSDGRLWVATEQAGVAIIDRKGATPQYTYITEGSSQQDLSGNSVRQIFEDRYQNVWIGLYGSGVNFLTYHTPMFDLIDYQPSNPQHSLTIKSVLSVCQDHDGHIWIGTDGDGLNIFANGSRLTPGVPLLAGLSVQAAVCDYKGSLWFGCFNDNAYIKLPGAPTFKKLFDGYTEDVRSFYEDNNGNMWVCTSNGIYQVDISKHIIKAHYSLGQNLTRTMLIDRKGRRWVGTFGQGIFICNTKMEIISTIDNTNGLPSNTVNQLTTDQNGNIWAATAEGLVKFDQKDKMTVYGWDSGLKNIHIRAIAIDANNNIWVSTNKGISCLKDGETHFSNYTANDNVPLANFNIGCAANGLNHTLLFGSSSGLSIFSPEKVLTERKAPDFNITDIKLYTPQGDSLIYLDKTKEITLRYNENTFRLGLSIDNYAYNDETEYIYRMEGLTGDWTIMDGSKLTFRNLKPGHYRLMVKSRICNHQWSEVPVELDITIAPPLWLSWWAYLLYLAIFIALCCYIYHIYQNYIHLRNLKEQWDRMEHTVNMQHANSDDGLEEKREKMQASLNELDQQFLSKINKLIEERITSDKIDISYLAEGVNVSQSTLYRKMKSLTGISSNEYVRKYKMHYAERLLLTGKYTISEVGYMVGMNSQSYFRKCFKDEFNVNPSDYQKQVKG